MKAKKAFDYLVCFEVTTASLDKPVVEKIEEVAEICWLTYDLREAIPLDENQIYIQPSFYEELNDDMLSGSGLSLSNLGAGKSLQEAIQEFDRYIYETFVSKGHSFCLITSSLERFKRFFYDLAMDKDVNLQAHFERLFDVTVEFATLNAGQSFTSLKACAEVAAIGFVEEAGNGLQTCRTIAQLVSHLCSQGHSFVNPIIVGVTEETTSATPVKSAATSAPSIGPAPSDATSTFTATNNSSGGIFLRLRGLPWEVTEDDIRAFVKGISLDHQQGVFVARNFQGRPNGEAYIKCASVADAEEGLKRHRKMMGRRYIEVFSATEAEMKAAIENSSKLLLPQAVQNTSGRYEGIVKMRGLPYHCTTEDVKQFFQGLQVGDDSVHRVFGTDGRPSGEAFVEFNSEELAGEAIKKFGERIGTRYIELFRSSKGEMEEILHRADLQVPTEGMIQGDLDAKCCIKLRGLPFDCTRQAIRDFFGPSLSAEIVENGIGIKYLRENRPSGEGFVEFSSEEIAEKAMSKQRAAIGTRYIELFRVPRREMMRALNLDGSSKGETGSSFGDFRPRPPFREPWGFRGGPRERGGFSGGRGRGRGRFDRSYDDREMPYGERQSFGYRGGRGSYSAPPASYDTGSYGYGGPGRGGYDSSYGMSGMGMYGGARDYSAEMQYMAGAAAQGYGMANQTYGVTPMAGGKLYHIKMRGLPYRATEQDIISFLRGYSVAPESISIAQGLDGRPSGEGWAGFYSYEEAQRAARELNGQRMYSRYIEIFPEP